MKYLKNCFLLDHSIPSESFSDCFFVFVILISFKLLPIKFTQPDFGKSTKSTDYDNTFGQLSCNPHLFDTRNRLR